MNKSPLFFFPLSFTFIIAFFFIILFIFIFIYVGLIGVAFEKLGIPPFTALLLLFASIWGHG